MAFASLTTFQLQDQESFSPAQHHGEFVRQTSSQCFDLPTILHDTLTTSSAFADNNVDNSNVAGNEESDGAVMIL